NDYLIEKPLNESSNLRIGKTDTIKIKFVPDKLETILGKLVIESDIADRPIRAVPPEGRNKIIYLRGRGTGAEISVSRDTFKFGKVVLHLNNTAKKTLPLTIGNIGNDILIINKFETEPPFTVSPADVVFASEQKDFQITFETTKIGIYTKELKIISSSIAPSSTVTIVLTAESVLPLPENISFPSDIRAKPGRIISVPLLADKSNISTARIFSDTISFNETLLRYNGFDKTNTASEAASYSEILINETSDKGRVAINITMPNNVFFAESDTLILLNFKTYLGNNLSTPIAFANPQFSDGYFLNVLTPVFRNGYFTLDSVCGLVYKLQPGGSNIFKFDECYPNPATDYIDMDFEIPFTVNVDIKILNTNGEFVKSGLESTLQAGKYKFTLPVRELSPGIYYCVIRCGLFSRVRKIIVTR
ncbi:MAG: T9SS type A sorting domain-containing protein, partial [Bacteroidota bacterium]